MVHSIWPKNAKNASTWVTAIYNIFRTRRWSGSNVLYLDFAKAFDKVPHKRLIQKLKCIKIHPKTVAWIQAWLENRKQRVIVNGTASEWTDVLSSVVQGSVLGPILFIIFINDIDSCTSDFEAFISKFADDIVNNETAATEMQTIINKLEQWSAQWGMPFNTNKCCILHLGYHNKKFPYSLYSQNTSTTAEQKDLGVMIDDSCKPSVQ